MKSQEKDTNKSKNKNISKTIEKRIYKAKEKNTSKALEKNLFLNRELSWLEFNGRVLEEACDQKHNPALERMKFLSIVSSNLDEFFMVRVASLIDQYQAGINSRDFSGMTPEEQLKNITARIQTMVKEQYEVYNNSLIP
ncbi:MAG: RNA degradosome polyphosphate kinase, partial [Bacillota bacterium]|nr:RNA degradosome polyphosphate kinase [Bacillota bacterium]